jgi:uroporphyrin-III C-methyltransferase
MNEPSDSPIPMVSMPPHPPVRTFWLWFCIVVQWIMLFLVGACAVFFYYDEKETRQQNHQAHKHALESLRQSLDAQVATLNQHTESIQKVEQAETKNTENLKKELGVLQQETSMRTDQLYQKLMAFSAVNRTDWLLEEIEHFIQLAHERLVLTHDARGAVSLLTHADEIASQVTEYGVEGVRTSLQEDMRALGVVAQLDTQGLFIQMTSVIELVEAFTLPDFVAEKPKVESAPAILNHSNEASQDFMSARIQHLFSSVYTFITQRLVRVYRVQQPMSPVMPPENQVFLKQNLRLLFEQAQLSLLRAEKERYLWCLSEAFVWVERYFPQSDPKTKEIKSMIQSLKQVNISPEIPPVDRSLESIRVFREVWLKRKEERQKKVLDLNSTSAG